MPLGYPTWRDARQKLTAHAAFSMRTAIEAVGHNKLRAGLTSLGILFGVASVIAMLAIGKGAEQEILEQMRLLGSNNVMITPLVVQKEGQVKEEGSREVKKFSPGLTYADARAIASVIPAVEATSAFAASRRARSPCRRVSRSPGRAGGSPSRSCRWRRAPAPLRARGWRCSSPSRLSPSPAAASRFWKAWR